jgi:hypothetical protein
MNLSDPIGARVEVCPNRGPQAYRLFSKQLLCLSVGTGTHKTTQAECEPTRSGATQGVLEGDSGVSD